MDEGDEEESPTTSDADAPRDARQDRRRPRIPRRERRRRTRTTSSRCAERGERDRGRRAAGRHPRERAVRCAEPLTLARLAEVIAGPTRGELRAALARARERAERDRRGIRLVEVAGGYQFRTAPEHCRVGARLFQQRPWRLTRATLETLAIIAYKQPITRAEIEAIRGVDVDSVLASLLARSW